MHGKLPIMGYRIGEMAWITDMLTMPAASYACLKNLDCLVINALRQEQHPTHQTVREALAQISCIQPEEAFLIHASHQIGLHAEVEKELPPHVHLTYDGMVIWL